MSASDTDPRSDSTASPASSLQRVRQWFRFWRRRRNGDDQLRNAIEELLEDRADNDAEQMGADEGNLVLNVLELRDKTVADIAVPRADIQAVPEDVSLSALIKQAIAQGHSRLPVYHETLDDVIGMVHVKDLLPCVAGEREYRLQDVMREVLFIVPSMRVLDLLLEMRQRRVHMAVVVDEFGGTDGLVTIEDVVEEIVGEIEDEHDVAHAPQLLKRPDGTVIADARVTIDDFEDMAGPILTEEERADDIDTLGGLVFAMLGRVPARGELVTHSSGIVFEILDADPRRIRRLRLRNLPEKMMSGSATSAESQN